MVPTFQGRTRDKSKIRDEANTNRINLERASLEYTKSLNISKSERNNPYLIR